MDNGQYNFRQHDYHNSQNLAVEKKEYITKENLD